MLVKLKNGIAKRVSQNEFKLEKELQKFIEDNLEDLLNLEVVKSEFSIDGYRIDTLAFDKENKSFIIIEYKRGNSYSVIDQGYSYLATALNNKAELILDYNERTGNILKRDEVDWTQTKIFFISQSFTKFQKESLNFKDLPIELYEVKRYEGDLISFIPLKANSNAESINVISTKNEEMKKVAKEIQVYTLDDHYNNSSEKIVELYKQFLERIEEMIPDIQIEPKKLYIAFKNNKKNIVNFILRKNSLKIILSAKAGKLNDSKNLLRDISNVGHLATGDYEISISNDDELEYILSIIKDIIKI